MSDSTTRREKETPGRPIRHPNPTKLWEGEGMNTLGRIQRRTARRTARGTARGTARTTTGPAPWRSAGVRALGLAGLLLFSAITAPAAQAARSGLGGEETGLTTTQLDAGQSRVLELFIDTEGETLEGYVLGADSDVLSGSVTVSVEPATKIAEPQTALLMGVGLAGLAISGRKKRPSGAPRQLKLTHTLAAAV